MPSLSETNAEAERRFPYWNTPSVDRDRHKAGYWAFIAGAGWAQKTDAADVEIWRQD